LETLLFLGFLISVAYWAHKSGKRTGSIKGFNVGRRLRRLTRRSPYRGFRR